MDWLGIIFYPLKYMIVNDHDLNLFVFFLIQVLVSCECFSSALPYAFESLVLLALSFLAKVTLVQLVT